jgi:hypothetical protein
MYALVMTASTIAHIFLINGLCRLHGANSAFSKSYKGHGKSYITIAVNVSAALLAFSGFPKIAFTLMVIIALSWFIPSHKINTNQNGNTNFNESGL